MRVRALGVLALATVGLSACGGDDETVTVLAASSLTDVLPEIAALVEEETGGTVEISFAASSAIVQQVDTGADADVIVLAGEGPLETLDPGLTRSEPVILATNTISIAVPPDNPADVQGLADLAREDITLVVCAEQVPCGITAAEVFDQAGITPTIASFEPTVRATLSKVTSGEADAGLVYATDVAAAGDDVVGLDLPPEIDVVNRYPVLTLGNSEAGQAFVETLLSGSGQEILAEAGFGAP